MVVLHPTPFFSDSNFLNLATFLAFLLFYIVYKSLSHLYTLKQEYVDPLMHIHKQSVHTQFSSHLPFSCNFMLHLLPIHITRILSTLSNFSCPENQSHSSLSHFYFLQCPTHIWIRKPRKHCILPSVIYE